MKRKNIIYPKNYKEKKIINMNKNNKNIKNINNTNNIKNINNAKNINNNKQLSEKIILHRITQKSDNFGEMYYDIRTDNIYFKNRIGDIRLLSGDSHLSNKYDKNEHNKHNKRNNHTSNNTFKERNDMLNKTDDISIFLSTKSTEDLDKLVPELESDNIYLDENIDVNADVNADANVDEYKMIKIKGPSISIPLSIIINPKYGNITRIDNGNIIIKDNGFYRVTYNFAYHGSIYDIISCLSILGNNKNNIIPHSIHRSINRNKNDQEDDLYYNNNENINTINHIFYLKVSDAPIRLTFILKLHEYNIGKILCIHKEKSWICVDR